MSYDTDKLIYDTTTGKYHTKCQPCDKPLSNEQLTSIRTTIKQWLDGCDSDQNYKYYNQERYQQLSEFVNLSDAPVQQWASQYQMTFADFANYPATHSDVHVHDSDLHVVNLVATKIIATKPQVPDEVRSITVLVDQSIDKVYDGKLYVIPEVGHSLCSIQFDVPHYHQWYLGIPLQSTREAHARDMFVYIPLMNYQYVPAPGFSVAFPRHHQLAVDIFQVSKIRSTQILVHPVMAEPLERWQQSWGSPEFPIPEFTDIFESMTL